MSTCYGKCQGGGVLCEISKEYDNKTNTRPRTELRPLNILTILGSIVNMIVGDSNDHLMSVTIFTLIMNKMSM
jgi:hypothetical protein